MIVGESYRRKASKDVSQVLRLYQTDVDAMAGYSFFALHISGKFETVFHNNFLLPKTTFNKARF